MAASKVEHRFPVDVSFKRDMLRHVPENGRDDSEFLNFAGVFVFAATVALPRLARRQLDIIGSVPYQYHRYWRRVLRDLVLRCRFQNKIEPTLSADRHANTRSSSYFTAHMVDALSSPAR